VDVILLDEAPHLLDRRIGARLGVSDGHLHVASVDAAVVVDLRLGHFEAPLGGLAVQRGESGENVRRPQPNHVVVAAPARAAGQRDGRTGAGGLQESSPTDRRAAFRIRLDISGSVSLVFFIRTCSYHC